MSEKINRKSVSFFGPHEGELRISQSFSACVDMQLPMSRKHTDVEIYSSRLLRRIRSASKAKQPWLPAEGGYASDERHSVR